MNETAWVALSFIAFVSVLIYLKVPSKIGASLETQREQIKARLKEAQDLRAEAEKLFREAENELKNAQKEVDSLVSAAKQQADGIMRQASESVEKMIERRTKVAEQKIQYAENQAIAEIKSKVMNCALTAIENASEAGVTPESHIQYNDKSLKELSGLSLTAVSQ